MQVNQSTTVHFLSRLNDCVPVSFIASNQLNTSSSILAVSHSCFVFGTVSGAENTNPRNQSPDHDPASNARILGYSVVTVTNSSLSSWEKRKKREKEREFVRLTCTQIRGFFCSPPAPVSRERKEDKSWLKRQQSDSSLFLPGIKPNRVKRPANHIQDIEIRPKPIIRKVQY